MILVDSSVWIDFFNAHESAEKKQLADLIAKGNDIAIMGIIIAEILSGIKSDKLFKEIKEILSHFAIISPTEESYISAANIYRKLRKNGLTIRSLTDCLIAQITMENDLSLLAKDKDFLNIQKVFPHLQTIKPDFQIN